MAQLGGVVGAKVRTGCVFAAVAETLPRSFSTIRSSSSSSDSSSDASGRYRATSRYRRISRRFVSSRASSRSSDIAQPVSLSTHRPAPATAVHRLPGLPPTPCRTRRRSLTLAYPRGSRRRPWRQRQVRRPAARNLRLAIHCSTKSWYVRAAKPSLADLCQRMAALGGDLPLTKPTKPGLPPPHAGKKPLELALKTSAPTEAPSLDVRHNSGPTSAAESRAAYGRHPSLAITR